MSMDRGRGKKKTGLHLLCGLLLSAIFTGCGNKTTDSNVAAATGSQIYYSIRETAIPDPDEDLIRELGENTGVLEQFVILEGDTLYRISQCWTIDESSEAGMTSLRYCIQMLRPPYQKWDSEQAAYGRGILTDILDIREGVIDFLTYDHSGYFVSQWRAGTGELDLFPEERLEDTSENIKFRRNMEGGYFAYEAFGNSIHLLDEEFQIQETKALGSEALIYGVAQEPENGVLCWYGMKSQEFGFWRMADGAAILPEGQLTDGVDRTSCQVQSTRKGNFYLADCRHLWLLSEGTEPVKLLDFLDRGYLLEDVYSMTIKEDGDLLMLAKLEGRNFLLELKESERPDDFQDIVLATTYLPNSGLRMLISHFNRQSDRCYITILEPEKDEDWSEFIQRLQLELAAGRGPDIYSEELINVEEMVQNGYLQSLEGILEDDGDYWAAALDCGIVDNVRYGIPGECIIWLAAYSQELTGSRSSWTLQEMMDAVRNSDVKMLQKGVDGCRLVVVYGLYDVSNKDYIDWEAGKSHLSEKPFLELLEFAREYADVDKYSMAVFEEMLKKGEIAAENAGLFGVERLSDLNYLEACFDGRVSVIGYPRAEGNGIYVDPQMLYLSAASDKRDGAEEFFRFLLSEESQRAYAEFLMIQSSDIISYPLEARFPVRLSALDRLVEVKQAEKAKAYLTEKYGIRYQSKGFTKEQVERFRFIIENAMPIDAQIEQVADIVYEELEPYFQGILHAETADGRGGAVFLERCKSGEYHSDRIQPMA